MQIRLLLVVTLAALLLTGCTVDVKTEADKRVEEREAEIKWWAKHNQEYFKDYKLAEDQARILTWYLSGSPYKEPNHEPLNTDKIVEETIKGHNVLSFLDYSKYVKLLCAYAEPVEGSSLVKQIGIEWENTSPWPIDWIQFTVYYLDNSQKPITIAHEAVEGVENNKIIYPNETGKTTKLMASFSPRPSEVENWSGQFGVEVNALLFKTPEAELVTPDSMQVLPSKAAE